MRVSWNFDQACHSRVAAGGHYCALSRFPHLLKRLLTSEAWQPHCAALLEQPALRTAVLDCLLQHVLPALVVQLEAAAGMAISWEAVQPVDAAEVRAICIAKRHASLPTELQAGPGEAWLEGLLHSKDTHLQSFGQLPLITASISAMSSSEGLPRQAAAALLLNAARLAAALPQQRPAAMPPRAFALMHTSVSVLASISSLSPQLVKSAAAAQPAAPDVAQGDASSSASNQQLSVGLWAILRLVPCMARTLRAVVADLPATAVDVETLALVYENVLQLLDLAKQNGTWQIGSWEQLSQWAAAADAGLRLSPTLAEAHASLGQWRATGLPLTLFACLASDASRMASEWHDNNLPVPPASREALASQLWQLHSSAARLVHFSGNGAPQLLIKEEFRQHWPRLQWKLLHHAFLLAYGVQMPRSFQEQPLRCALLRQTCGMSGWHVSSQLDWLHFCQTLQRPVLPSDLRGAHASSAIDGGACHQPHG